MKGKRSSRQLLVPKSSGTSAAAPLACNSRQSSSAVRRQNRAVAASPNSPTRREKRVRGKGATFSRQLDTTSPMACRALRSASNGAAKPPSALIRGAPPAPLSPPPCQKGQPREKRSAGGSELHDPLFFGKQTCARSAGLGRPETPIKVRGRAPNPDQPNPTTPRRPRPHSHHATSHKERATGTSFGGPDTQNTTRGHAPGPQTLGFCGGGGGAKSRTTRTPGPRRPRAAKTPVTKNT